MNMKLKDCEMQKDLINKPAVIKVTVSLPSSDINSNLTYGKYVHLSREN